MAGSALAGHFTHTGGEKAVLAPQGTPGLEGDTSLWVRVGRWQLPCPLGVWVPKQHGGSAPKGFWDGREPQHSVSVSYL